MKFNRRNIFFSPVNDAGVFGYPCGKKSKP